MPPIIHVPLALRPTRLLGQLHWRRFRAAGLRVHTVALPGASIRLWRGGTGRPLLLLQGFGASALWQWSGQVGPFAHAHTLLVPDLLGFGGSHLHSGSHTLDRQVEAIRDLLDHCQLSEVDIVGISYGGFVALRLAEHHPARVRRLVLVDSPGMGYTPADYQDMLQRYRIQHISELLLPAHPDQIRRLLTVAWHRPPHVPSWILRSIHQDLFLDRLPEKLDMLDDVLGLLHRPEGPPAGTLPHRALVLWGEHDPLFPLHLGARLAARLGGELRTLPKAAHAPNIEHTHLFNHHVSSFLRA